MTTDFPGLFTVTLAGLGGDRFAAAHTPAGADALLRHEFEWRTGTLRYHEDITTGARAAKGQIKNPDAVRDDLGRRLGAAALEATPREGLTLLLRTDPDTAADLEALPWELIAWEGDFLLKDGRVTIARLPLNVPFQEHKDVGAPLRVLVVVSAPTDLPDDRILNVERKLDMILTATDRAQREGKLQIDFCEDADPDTIEAYLNETDYHILHFTGHDGQGALLLEMPDGRASHAQRGDGRPAAAARARVAAGGALGAPHRRHEQ